MAAATRTVAYWSKTAFGVGGQPAVFGGPIQCQGATGIRFDLDVESVTGGFVVIVVQSWDDVKKAWITEVASSDQLLAPGHVITQIDPRIPPVGASLQRILPARLRARVGGTATAFTASISYTLGD